MKFIEAGDVLKLESMFNNFIFEVISVHGVNSRLINMTVLTLTDNTGFGMELKKGSILAEINMYVKDVHHLGSLGKVLYK